MRLTLKGFSQDVQMESPEEPQDFLVFSSDDGRELRLPVGQETVKGLVDFIFGSPDLETSTTKMDFVPELRVPHVAPPPELEEGATEFGAEESSYLMVDDDEEALMEDDGQGPPDRPTSEEEIPSL